MEETVLPQTATESLLLLNEVEAFMQSETYRVFISDINDEVLTGSKNAVKRLPQTIGAILEREQAFGGIERLIELLEWFPDRARAIREHIESLKARSNEPITPQDNE